MQVYINAEEAEFRANLIASTNVATARSNLSGWLSPAWSGINLLEEYSSHSGFAEHSRLPIYWGWTIEKHPSNFNFYVVGRPRGSGFQTRNIFDAGKWRPISVELANNSNPSPLIRHPMVLDLNVGGSHNGDELRQVLAYNFEYAFFLTRVPNANDDASTPATANNLPEDFEMEFRVFI